MVGAQGRRQQVEQEVLKEHSSAKKEKSASCYILNIKYKYLKCI